MSEAELQATLQATSDHAAVTETLANTIGKPGLGRLLEYLSDHSKALSLEQSKNLLIALFEVGDQADTRAPGMFQPSARDRVVFLASQIFKQMENQEKRDETFNLVAKGAKSLSTLVDFLALVNKAEDRQQYVANDGQAVFSSRAIDEAKGRVVCRVRESAHEGKLLMLPDQQNVIFRWRDWAGTEEVSNYLSETVRTDEGLLQVLVAFVSEMKTSTGDEYSGVTITRFVNRENLGTFLNLETLTARAQALLQSPLRELKQDETLALQTFVNPPENIRRLA